MRLLLTSSGIANTSIHDALLGLLGKPIEESSALVIPAIYSSPAVLAWMRRSGLADVLPSLPSETVYLGVSAPRLQPRTLLRSGARDSRRFRRSTA